MKVSVVSSPEQNQTVINRENNPHVSGLISLKHPSIMPDQDVYDVYTNTRMFKAMKPLFISMKIFGLFFFRKYGTVQENSKKHGAKIKKAFSFSFSRLYSLLGMLITAVLSLRSFSMFGVGSNEVGAVLFSKFGLIAWYVMCLVNHVLCFMASNSYSKLPRFFILLEQLSTMKDIQMNEAWIRKLVLIVVAGFAWPTMLVFSGLWIYMAIYQVEWMDLPFAPLSVNSPDVVIMQFSMKTCSYHLGRT